MSTINITPAIKSMYNQLSPVNLKFLKTVEQNPEYLKRENFQELIDWQHISTPVRLQPWPFFINNATQNHFAEASTRIFDLIKTLPWRIFSLNPKQISEYFQLPLEHVKYFLFSTSQQHIQGLLGRGDFILSHSGLKCVEFNATSTLGGWELPIWEILYKKNPLIAGFINRHHLKIKNQNLLSILFDNLIDMNNRLFPQEQEINIAVAIFDPKFVQSMESHDSYLNQLYMQQLSKRNTNESKNGHIVFCMLNQLHKENEYLYYQDKRIHTIIDYAAGDIPIDILALSKMEKVLLYNGPVSFIISDKLNLALLSELEDSEIFSNEERQTIKEYIPWTRKMASGQTTYKGEKIDLENFVRENQEQLVLKPSGGHGGEGVYVGIHTSTTQWQEAVTEALQQKRWLVQERVEGVPLIFQEGENNSSLFDAVFGMFVYGNTYGGVLLRTMPQKQGKGVINSLQGAKVPIIFEVEE